MTIITQNTKWTTVTKTNNQLDQVSSSLNSHYFGVTTNEDSIYLVSSNGYQMEDGIQTIDFSSQWKIYKNYSTFIVKDSIDLSTFDILFIYQSSD